MNDGGKGRSVGKRQRKWEREHGHRVGANEPKPTSLTTARRILRLKRKVTPVRPNRGG